MKLNQNETFWKEVLCFGVELSGGKGESGQWRTGDTVGGCHQHTNQEPT